MQANGTFHVDLQPLADDTTPPNRLSINKQFHGDLEATSQGQMLSVMTEVKGSAGYVAIEQVSGTLHGRQGTFVLQHSGIMTRGQPSLTIVVVPDSGTGELAGLSGTMTIDITDGQHFYTLDYQIEG